MIPLSRRRAIVMSAIAVAIVSSSSVAEEVKKPISESILRKNIYSMVSGVYEDATKYGIKLPEDYVEMTSADIWPEIQLIAERRFVIMK